MRSHAPDFFARRADRTGVVLDCRPDERIKPQDAVAFDVTERACELVGWEYRRCGAIEQPLLGNVRWLAGYRHPRFADHRCSELLCSVFAAPRPLLDGVKAMGSRMAVLPVLFHLLWYQRLRTDLSGTFSEASVVWAAPPPASAS